MRTEDASICRRGSQKPRRGKGNGYGNGSGNRVPGLEAVSQVRSIKESSERGTGSESGERGRGMDEEVKRGRVKRTKG